MLEINEFNQPAIWDMRSGLKINLKKKTEKKIKVKSIKETQKKKSELT